LGAYLYLTSTTAADSNHECPLDGTGGWLNGGATAKRYVNDLTIALFADSTLF